MAKRVGEHRLDRADVLAVKLPAPGDVDGALHALRCAGGVELARMQRHHSSSGGLVRVTQTLRTLGAPLAVGGLRLEVLPLVTFSCGRQFCAWLGLVPGQYSSGGKQRLGRITKARDAYLRTLLIMGAKAGLAAAKNKTHPVSRWAIQIQDRRGYWTAVVAVAAKNARMCWAMLQRGEDFKMHA